MSTYFWKRHSNPWSGWTRFTAYPLLILTMYTQQWVWLMGMIFFFVVNPVLFPEPKSKNAWMTKVVLGEEIWINQGRRGGFLMAINVVNSFIFLGLLWAALTQKLFLTIFGVLMTAGLKLWFCYYMVKIYEEVSEKGTRC